MLLCEASIFLCSIFILKWDLTSKGSLEGYEDMEVCPAIDMMCNTQTQLYLVCAPTQN